jgi:acyl-CoA thioesterase I
MFLFSKRVFLFVFILLNSAPVFAQNPKKRVLFFGDSITAGYGLEKSQAFPALLQEKVDSLQVEVEMINGGLSGETSAGGLRRVDWMLQKPIDIFVLELGGNDGLRGIDVEDTKKNLIGIIDKVRSKNPNTIIILAGMQVPPNLGKQYTSDFASIFPTVAKEKKTGLIPFLLEGVAGIPNLNLPDGIHPTASGHKILAKTVWKYIEKDVLKK